MRSVRLLGRDGMFMAVLRLPVMHTDTILLWRGVYFVMVGKPIRRADGTVEQDYQETGVLPCPAGDDDGVRYALGHHHENRSQTHC